MSLTLKLLGLITITNFIFGCASKQQYFDSALNDKNRAPASLAIPDSYDQVAVASDVVQNRAAADFLFITSELDGAVGKKSQTINILNSALEVEPNSATLMHKLALEYYKAGKTEESMLWAEKALKKSPDKKDVQLLVAGLYTTVKKFDKAAAIYEKISKDDSEDAEALLYLGAVYTEQKKYNKAINCFNRLSLVAKTSAKYLSHYYLARVYSEQNPKNLKPVADQLEKAIKAKPDFYEAVEMLMAVKQQQQGTKAAYQYLEDYQNKNGYVSKFSEKLAQYYIQNNDLDNAFEQLQALEASDNTLIDVKLKLALILIEKKMHDLAIAKLEEILKLVPESDKVRFYLGAVYEEDKNSKKAFIQYQAINKDSSYYEEASVRSAYLAKVMGKNEEALSILKNIVQEGSTNMQPYLLMSELYEVQGKGTEALELLNSIEDKFSDQAQYFYYRGVLQDRLALKSEMVESMKKAVSLNNNHAQAMNYLAYTWAENKENLDQAERYAREAVKLEKNDAFVLDTLGWVLFKKSDYKKALKVLEQAHSMLPDASIIVEHIGDVYTTLKQDEKARDLFLKALSLEEDNGRKSAIKEKIAEVENRSKNLRLPASLSTGLNADGSP